MAYPGLSGRPLRQTVVDAGRWELLAGDLGRFLAALHRVPQSVVEGLLQSTRPRTGRDSTNKVSMKPGAVQILAGLLSCVSGLTNYWHRP